MMKHLLATFFFFISVHSIVFADFSRHTERQYIITQILVKGKPVYRVAGCAVLRKGDRNEYGNVSMGRDILRWRLSPGDKIEVLNPDTEIIVRRGGRYHSLKMERAGKVMRWYVPALRKPIRQTQGRVYYKFRKHPRRRKQVIADWGRQKVSIATDGTEFLFKTGQGKFSLKLTEGRVRVALPSGKSISLKAGEQLQGSFKDSSYTKSSLQRREWKTLLSEGKKIIRSTTTVYKDDLSFVENNRVIRYKYKKEHRLQEEKATHVFKSRKEADDFASRLRARKIKLINGRDYWKAAVVFSRGGKEGKKVAHRFFKKAIQLGVTARLTKYLYEEFGYFLVHSVNRLSEGEALLKKGLQKYRSYAAYWVLLQELYAKQKDWGKLQTAVAKLKALSGGKYLWYKNRAKWHQRYGKSVMAEINYRKAWAIIIAKGGPRTVNHFWTVIELSRVIKDLGGNLEVAFLLSRYLEKVKKNNGTLAVQEVFFVELADAYLLLGKTGKALDFYKKAFIVSKRNLELEPKNISRSIYLSVAYQRLGIIYDQLGKSNLALANYKKAFSVLWPLYKLNKKSINIARVLVVLYSNVGDIYLKIGNTKGALDCYKNVFRGSQRLYKADASNVLYSRRLAVSCEKLGTIYYRKYGDSGRALRYYQKAFEITKKMYKANNKNIEYAKDLSRLYSLMGVVYLKIGKAKKATIYYEQSIQILDRLLKQIGKDISLLSDLAQRCLRLGYLYLQQGDTRKASAYYVRAMGINEGNVHRDPLNSECVRSFAVNLLMIGDLFTIGYRDFKQGFYYYQQSVLRFKRLFKQDSKNNSIIQELAKGYGKLAYASSKLGDFKKTEKYYRLSCQLLSKLKPADNVDVAYNLAITCMDFGKAYLKYNKPSKAIGLFKRGISLLKRLFGKDTNNVSYKRHLAVCYVLLGDYYLKIKEAQRAIVYYNKGHAILKKLHQKEKGNVIRTDDLNLVYRRFVKALLFNLKKHEDNYKKNKLDRSFANKLFYVYSSLGKAYRLQKKIVVARNYFHKAEPIAYLLHKRNPEQRKYTAFLFRLYLAIGMLYQEPDELKKGAHYIVKAYLLIKPIYKSEPTFTYGFSIVKICEHIVRLQWALQDHVARRKYSQIGIATLQDMKKRGFLAKGFNYNRWINIFNWKPGR